MKIFNKRLSLLFIKRSSSEIFVYQVLSIILLTHRYCILLKIYRYKLSFVPSRINWRGHSWFLFCTFGYNFPLNTFVVTHPCPTEYPWPKLLTSIILRELVFPTWFIRSLFELYLSFSVKQAHLSPLIIRKQARFSRITGLSISR